MEITISGEPIDWMVLAVFAGIATAIGKNLGEATYWLAKRAWLWVTVPKKKDD